MEEDVEQAATGGSVRGPPPGAAAGTGNRLTAGHPEGRADAGQQGRDFFEMTYINTFVR